MNPLLLPLPSKMMGERVIVRPYGLGDGKQIFAGVDASRARLKEFLPWIDSHACEDDSEAYARACFGRWIQREDLAVAICERETGAIVGGSGLHQFDWKVRSFMVGYWIRSASEGKGFVRETVELLTALAFQRLDAIRVHIRCDPINVRSAAIPRRLGFHEEGTLVNDGRTPSGAPRDTLVFGMDPTRFRATPWHARAVAVVNASDRDA